ncbi:MAG: formylglycine-generating enzyme family protein [Thermodesulfovibrionales bacterium]
MVAAKFLCEGHHCEYQTFLFGYICIEQINWVEEVQFIVIINIPKVGRRIVMKSYLMLCILLVLSSVAPVNGDEGKVVDPTTGMEFTFVKGGCFKMGDFPGDGEVNEKPVHEVCVSDFYIGKYEVTQSQWEKVMGKNPSTYNNCGPDCPVDFVSWNMAQEFVTKLIGKSGNRYRLPTEAEWEYAARNGGKEEVWAGTSKEVNLKDFAWYNESAKSVTHRVGLKKPNGLGLHDMSGNVLEWCLDWYNSAYYGESPTDNPPGPTSGKTRILRGGGFGESVKEVRTTYRFNDEPDTQDHSYGVRLLLSTK